MSCPSVKARPVALITGASRGIGAGIALELAAAGFNLALHYNTNDAALIAADDFCGVGSYGQQLLYDCHGFQEIGKRPVHFLLPTGFAN